MLKHFYYKQTNKLTGLIRQPESYELKCTFESSSDDSSERERARRKQNTTINFSHLNFLLLLFFIRLPSVKCQMRLFLSFILFFLLFHSSFIGGAINVTKEDLGNLFLGGVYSGGCLILKIELAIRKNILINFSVDNLVLHLAPNKFMNSHIYLEQNENFSFSKCGL